MPQTFPSLCCDRQSFLRANCLYRTNDSPEPVVRVFTIPHRGICGCMGHNHTTCNQQSCAYEAGPVCARKEIQFLPKNMDFLTRTPSRVYVDDSDAHDLGKPLFYQHVFVFCRHTQKFVPAVNVVLFTTTYLCLKSTLRVVLCSGYLQYPRFLFPDTFTYHFNASGKKNLPDQGTLCRQKMNRCRQRRKSR